MIDSDSVEFASDGESNENAQTTIVWWTRGAKDDSECGKGKKTLQDTKDTSSIHVHPSYRRTNVIDSNTTFSDTSFDSEKMELAITYCNYNA